MSERQQRIRFKDVLEQQFGKVEVEGRFPWLFVPNHAVMDSVLARIYDRLVCYRGFREFTTDGFELSCDFCFPAAQLIIEYDERQHFTEARAFSLEEYEPDLLLGFDRYRWIGECRAICARDNLPPYRDEQRSFYDALRDILAAKIGFRLIRIKHGDRDWNHPESGEYLRELIARFFG